MSFRYNTVLKKVFFFKDYECYLKGYKRGMLIPQKGAIVFMLPDQRPQIEKVI